MWQVDRRESAPEQAVAIDGIIEALRSYSQGGINFTFKLDDPSGNSHIEGDAVDSSLRLEQYQRTVGALTGSSVHLCCCIRRACFRTPYCHFF